MVNLRPAPTTDAAIAHAHTERGELVLRRRPDSPGSPGALELRANGVFVMDTVEVSTERALARAALHAVASPDTVLVGGLGLGFTMHEVLADQRVERCVVVEIEPALVQWMRDGTVPHGPAMMADQRLEVVVADLAEAVATAAPDSFDLILMDVDNGPGYLVHDSNAALYDSSFLQQARAALRPGGAVAVWSAAEAPALAATMAQVFGRVRAEALAVDLQGRAERYYLYHGWR